MIFTTISGDNFDISCIQLRRLEAGEWVTHHAMFSPAELDSPAELHARFGGGSYELIGQNAAGEVVRREKLTLAGESRPFVPGAKAGVVAPKASGLLGALGLPDVPVGLEAVGLVGLLVKGWFDSAKERREAEQRREDFQRAEAARAAEAREAMNMRFFEMMANRKDDSGMIVQSLSNQNQELFRQTQAANERALVSYKEAITLSSGKEAGVVELVQTVTPFVSGVIEGLGKVAASKAAPAAAPASVREVVHVVQQPPAESAPVDFADAVPSAIEGL